MPVIYINNDDIRLNSSSSDKVVVTGNLGVGTTSPAYKLDVSGDIRSATIDLATQGVNVSSYGFLSQTLSGQMTFLGHNVRASNTVNNTALVVNGGWISSLIKQYYNEGITFHTSTTEYAAGATYPLADTERMRITSAGNVGIGTTSPTYKLHVNGEGNGLYVIGANSAPYTQTIASFVYGGNSNSINIENQGGKASFQARDSSNNAMNLHLNPVGGNVGIGTTGPAVSLQVNASTAAIRLEETSASAKRLEFSIDSSAVAKISANQSAQSIAFETVGSERMRITSGGQVLINSTSMDGKLGINTATSVSYNPNAYNGTYANIRLTNGSAGVSRYTGIAFGGGGATEAFIGSVQNASELAEIVFQTYNGSAYGERARITSAGNVGIGTTSPGFKLHIKSSGLGSYPLVVQRAANNNNIFYIYEDGSGNGTLTIENSGGGDAVSLNSNGVSYLNGGNVGIGTTSPGVKLTTQGASGFPATSGTTQTNGAFRIQDGSTAVVDFGVAGGNAAWLQSTNAGSLGTNYSFAINPNGGNVGIGTTAPTAKLQVVLPANTNSSIFQSTASEALLNIQTFPTTNRMQLLVGDYNGTSTPNIAAISDSNTGIQWAGSDILRFVNGGSENVTINAAGNVGIGTTSPATKFHVHGYTNIDSVDVVATFSSNNTDKRVNIGYSTSGDYGFINAVHTGVAWKNLIFGVNGGNVGIGTTGPTEKLHVDGSTLITYNNSFQSTNSVGNKAILARVSPTSGIINYAEYATAANLNGFVIGSDDARVKGNITGDSLEFITNTSTRMTVLSSGNVGINTTTPGSTLHVVGDVLIQTGALGVGVNPNATDGRIDASNDIVAFSTSDKRLKENITPIANALEKVRSLTGVEFDWKEETKSVHGYEGHDVGVIAQDVQAVLPEAVRTNDTGYLSVRYEKMIALLIEANKELANRVEQLEKLIK